MPSLRKRVSTYFRQLSFHNEPRQRRNNVNENAFVTKYLQGHITLKEDAPSVEYGKTPSDLPSVRIGPYETGYNSIVSCYSGPHGGLTTIRRKEKHLSVPDADDLDFIDTREEEAVPTLPKKSPKRTPGQPVDNTKMVIKVAGQEYFVKNDTKKHKKSQSLGSISDFKIEIEKTKIDREFYDPPSGNDKKESNNNNNKKVESKNCVDTAKESSKQEDLVKEREPVRKSNRERRRNVNREPPRVRTDSQGANKPKNFNLVKSKSEGNPFRHKGTKKCVERPQLAGNNNPIPTVVIDDSNLPHEWNKKSDHFYGISESLYDTNLVTKVKNGDPIADCFGIIARFDSMILAVADGVNWGEKACVAAKSAIHGCLHYLNKTIFNDTKLFENLVVVSDQNSSPPTITEPLSQLLNTTEVFVCLLRAFSCAHDLILENNGMLTTLTAAVVLPINTNGQKGVDFVCCVCNVGDTLAYVYSRQYGLRELTKGSHDVTSNRDMRDALGALGPVDGINPELSNLTLSLTFLEKGDIVMVASDGLTDNFDPNVCKFTVNTTAKANPSEARNPPRNLSTQTPVKPPRRSQLRKEGSVESYTKPESPPEEVKTNPAPVAKTETDGLMDNPLIAHFMKQHSVDESKEKNAQSAKKVDPKTRQVVENKASSLRRQTSSGNKNGKPSTSQGKPAGNATGPQGYSFLRSKTSIDIHSPNKKPILRNDEGIPYVTPLQRYELQLLLMEDILKRGISGKEHPCIIARILCENLVNFTMSITAAKRRTLEDVDLYFDNRDGVLVEVSPMEKKQRRKRGLEKVLGLPGKLDHVTVVAGNVGNYANYNNSLGAMYR